MRNLCGKSRARRRGAAVERSSVAGIVDFFLVRGDARRCAQCLRGSWSNATLHRGRIPARKRQSKRRFSTGVASCFPAERGACRTEFFRAPEGHRNGGVEILCSACFQETRRSRCGHAQLLLPKAVARTGASWASEAESWLFGTWSFENAALRCALNLSARGQARLERRPLKFPSRPFESGTSRWDPSSEALTRGVVSSGRRTSAGVTPLSFFSGAWLSAKRRRDDRSPRLQSLVARR